MAFCNLGMEMKNNNLTIIVLMVFICFPAMGLVRSSHGFACDASPCRSGIANDACCQAIAESVEKGMCSFLCRSLNQWGYSSLPSKCAATGRCKSCSVCTCTTRDFELPLDGELWHTYQVCCVPIINIFYHLNSWVLNSCWRIRLLQSLIQVICKSSIQIWPNTGQQKNHWK